MRRMKRRNRRGFSLLEIMLVLVILVVVAGIVGVNIFGFQNKAYSQTAKTQISSFKNFIELYRLNVGTFPNTLDDLYKQPGDLADPTKWTQVTKEPIPADPWGRPYQYKVQGDKYEIICVGADGQENTEDDIKG